MQLPLTNAATAAIAAGLAGAIRSSRKHKPRAAVTSSSLPCSPSPCNLHAKPPYRTSLFPTLRSLGELGAGSELADGGRGGELVALVDLRRALLLDPLGLGELAVAA